MKHLDFSFSIGELPIDARVDYADDPHHIKETSLMLHEHVLYEVYFIERGSLALQCGGDRLSVKAGDILIIAPHIPHKILSYDEALVRFNVQFMLKGTIDPPPYAFFCPEEPVRSEIFAQITHIRRYMTNAGNQADLFRMNASFSILLSYIVEHLLPADAFESTTAIDPKNHRLRQCIQIDQFFFGRYAEAITISDLAAELNYSKTQAGRILREYTGMSFAQNLSHTRLQAARQYLAFSRLSIEEIAERCGYRSRKGFETMFKKQMQVSPHQYRMEHRKL